MNMTFNGFCEGLYPNNQGGDTLFSLVRKLNELLPEMIEGIEEGGDSDINNLKLYYDTPSQSLQLQGVEGKVISEISAAPFIKDGMLNAVENNETEHIITLTFNTDAGKQPITLNYDSLWEGMETSLKGYTDSQVATLSSQVVKGIRLGSSTSNEPISDGVVTLPVASGVEDGVMSSADKTKLDSIISSGDGTKFLADDFTYKTIQMPDLSTYATKSELSGYLPLSGGSMTGNLRLGDQGNRIVYIVNYNGNSLLGYNGTENVVGGLDNSLVLLTSLSKKNGYLFRRSYNVNDGVWSDDYTIYDSGNFKAGTNYVAPSTLNNYLPLSGGAMSGNITMNGANSNIYLRNSATITGYFGEDALPILYSDGTTNRVVLGTVGKRLQVRSNNPIIRTNTNSTEYTIYDSGNLDVSSFVTTSGNENLVFPQRAITVGRLDADEYNYYRVARNNSYSYFTNSSTATVINYETYGSGGSVDATSKLEITTSDLTFNDNHVLTETDTFNTITYTTSASEDNLRAWNNYVNGYVTNLQAVDSSAFGLIRQSSGVDKVNRKFEVIIMGGSPRKLILITYTLAEDGSLTKTQENYTLTPATA